MFISAKEPKAYDAAGNRLTKTAVQTGNPNPASVTSQYSYDPIYELTQAVVNVSVAEGYTYDAVGNRLTKTAVRAGNPNPVPALSQYGRDSIHESTQPCSFQFTQRRDL
jgi:uncharacterized protein RhaS with RHS repeats